MASAVATGTDFVRWFDTIGIEDIPLVGGKNAALGEMYQVIGESLIQQKVLAELTIEV